MANSGSPSSSMASLDFPDEIIAEILEKLTGKDLLRFKIVSKLWLSIISDPQFIKSHHLRRALTPTLLRLEWELDPDPLDFMDGEEEYQPDPQLNPRVRLRSGPDSPVRFEHVLMPRVFYHFRAVGYCNGIICLGYIIDSSVFYLWNPLLKHYKMLPVPEPHHDLVIDTWSSSFRMGFGYDSISNDYKVLRFVSKIENDNDPIVQFYSSNANGNDPIVQLYSSNAISNDPIVQLYSSNADSWREFTDPILANLGPSPRDHVDVNGVLYFHGGSYFDNHGVSFDLHEEVFGQVYFPSFATLKKSDFLDFEGSVAMVFKCSGDEDEFTLCTLDTVSGTWTKKFSLLAGLWLSLYLGAGQFYGNLDGEPGRSSCNVIYDYEKKEAYYYQVPVSLDIGYKVLKYTESLVSSKGYEKVVYNPKQIRINLQDLVDHNSQVSASGM